MQDNTGLAPGSKIGPFRVVEKIAEGGMGEIYQGHDDELNRRLAIKILLPSALREPDGLNRFKAEARALAQIDHPSVVRIHVAGESDGLHFMALEYIDGLPLEIYLTRYSPSLTEVLDIFTQMTEGLMAAHELEIVHRDIKPQNVMVTSQGKVKVVDFGVAKAQTDHDNFKTSVGIVVGTRSFLAPEILRGAPATKQGDIYSLGLILKFMLTGDMPTATPSTDGGSRPTSAKISLLLPQTLTNLINGLVHPATNLRYSDLKDVLRDLKQINFKHLPQNLLASVPSGGPVRNLENLIAICRERGLDIIDTRMAINLSAKPGPPVQVADNGKTQVMDLNAPQEIQVVEETLTRAIARVQQTKAQVLTGGVRVAPTAQQTESAVSAKAVAAPAKPSGDLPYFKIAFVVIVMIIALRAFFVSSSGPGGVLAIFQSLGAAVQSFTTGLDRGPASTEN